MAKSSIFSLAVLSLALVGPAQAAPDRDAALTLASSRAHALAAAVARLDPSRSPYTLVCRQRDGSFAVALIKWNDPAAPFPDGMRCFGG